KQGIQRGGMPEQRRDILGVVPPIQHPLPGAGQAQQAAPDVELFEKEALHVVRLHGQSISTPAAGKMSVARTPSPIRAIFPTLRKLEPDPLTSNAVTHVC